MLRAMFRGLMAHRLRLAMTALAIALGVGFHGRQLRLHRDPHPQPRLAHRPGGTPAPTCWSSTLTGRAASARAAAQVRPFPPRFSPSIRGLPDVRAADGGVTGRAQLLGRSGKALPAQFTVAASWPADAAFQAIYTRREGRPPAGPARS